PHAIRGAVPGDSLCLLLQDLIGTKRASYDVLLGNTINAEAALDLGLVNEILPQDKLLPRAWELAEDLMKRPRAARRLTHQLMIRPWKRLFIDDYQFHIAQEMYGSMLMRSRHDFTKGKRETDNK
ncbi:enoyl-CoA hydratase/isomerase family protein, partial [Chloroflexota bacterium]